MIAVQNRRRFLAGLSGIGAVTLLRGPALAAEGPPEKTSVRLPRLPSICVAPQDVVADLLRAEGFTDIRYVPLPPGVNTPDAIAQGTVDFGLNYAPVQIAGIDRGVAMKVLAGIHIGCFELFVTGAIRGVPDLAGKKVGIVSVGTPEHLFLTVIFANVGIDPKAQIDWVTSGPKIRPKELFVDGKIDAFLGFPPEPQELRATGVGRVIVDSALDRPWSQYFCCMLAANADYVANHPVASKRVVRAILKAADLCTRDPAFAARRLVDGGFTPRYDYALQTLQELPYDKWREYDHEDTIRFYALRLHELGMIKSTPQQIIAAGTDWRFLNELKRELKA
jgi:NitT/TauT family transport system substrate-binding protein